MDLPDHRRARRGTLDIGGQRLNLRREFPRLARNRKGTRRWVLRDAFGSELVSTTELNVTGFELQGRGAMVSDRLEDAHALVACHSPDLPDRLRGFLERRALPSALRADIDRVNVRHGHSGLAELRRIALLTPGFAWWEKFEGTDGKLRTYSTYNEHHGGIYVMVNTTGVYGGGIVRTVVPHGHPFAVLDETEQPDPNGQVPVRWLYGRVGLSRIYGWVPVRT